jgi:hypothetical protein
MGVTRPGQARPLINKAGPRPARVSSSGSVISFTQGKARQGKDSGCGRLWQCACEQAARPSFLP